MAGHRDDSGPRELVLEPEVISQAQEAELLKRFETLRWDPIVIRGQAARRTARHFDLRYDYGSRDARPGARREQRRTAEVQLEPRSGYVLAGEARWSWEHSIPPAKQLRYSITHRALKS